MTEQQNDRDDEGKFLPGNTIWQGRATFALNSTRTNRSVGKERCSETN